VAALHEKLEVSLESAAVNLASRGLGPFSSACKIPKYVLSG
jgi:hypothetical protein